MPLTIAIVGGGIGGLSAATALAIRGHTVTVYERANTTTDVGFAFRITPNSDRCLRHLGIDTVKGGAVAVSAVRAFDGSGNVVFERRENDKPDQANKGTSVFAFRPQLTQQLINAAQKNGVTIQTGTKVKHIDASQTQLTFIDDDDRESTISADLIIGSDGLHSYVRPSVIDSSKYHPTASSHHNCLRFMIPAKSIDSHPHLSKVINPEFNLASWRHGDKRILVYPVDFNNQYNLVCTHPESLSEDIMSANSRSAQRAQDTTYDNHITLQQSLDIYSDLSDPSISALFNLADPSGFRVWKLQDFELPGAQPWHRNRTLLIGDAAHAVLPFGFSGASMAIEDAIFLGELLTKDTRRDELPEILEKFWEGRKGRVRRVREVSRQIGAGEENKELLSGYMEFLITYDAVEEARKVRDGLDRGKNGGE